VRKITLIIFSFILSSFTSGGGYTYREIQYGESLIVTYDNNMGVIDWDRAGKKLAFEATFEGKSKIYYLNLFDLPINFSRSGLHVAKYVNELSDKKRVYVTLTENDTAFVSPKWSNDSRRVLSIGNPEESAEIFITNVSTRKTIGTKIKNIETAHWKNDTALFVVFKNEPKKLYLFDQIKNSKKLVTETNHPIIGINRQKTDLYLACYGGCYELSLKTKKLEWFELPIKGKTVSRLKRLNFVGLNYSGGSQVLDLNNAETHPFSVGENDGSPAISQDEKFVAFYSGYVNGIVIKRIDKKFYLE